MDMNEAKAKMAEWKKHWPHKEKYLSDQRRLIDLARNSMHAGVNADFLDRLDMELQRRKDDLEQEKSLCSLLETVEKRMKE